MYGTGSSTLISSGCGFDTDCFIVFTASVSPVTARFVAAFVGHWFHIFHLHVELFCVPVYADVSTTFRELP